MIFFRRDIRLVLWLKKGEKKREREKSWVGNILTDISNKTNKLTFIDIKKNDFLSNTVPRAKYVKKIEV